MKACDTLIIVKRYTYELKKGWNFISFPVIPANPNPFAIFGQEIWWYNPGTGQWETPREVKCKKGYGIHAPEDRVVTIIGKECAVTLFDLIKIYDELTGVPHEGSIWKLVGPGTERIDVENSKLEGHIQKFMGGDYIWEYTNILESSKGYWMEKPLTIEQTAVSGIRNPPFPPR